MPHTPGGFGRETKRRGCGVCAGRYGETQEGEKNTSEVNKRSHGCGHSVHSFIDLVFVGVQAFGSVHVVAEVLGRFLHGLQLAGVRRGPAK